VATDGLAVVELIECTEILLRTAKVMVPARTTLERLTASIND